MEERAIDAPQDAVVPPRAQHRARTVLIVGAALALLLVTATAVTAATGWRFGRFQNHAMAGRDQAPGMNRPGGQGGMPGIQGVVTALDESAKTVTIAGIPGVTTVTIDANVKLSAIQADGTTRSAALGDFLPGKVIRVHGKIDRGQITPGQRPNPANFKLTVTEIVLQSGVARGFGLVTAVSGNTVTINEMGGLSLTVTPGAGATLKKMDGSTFAMSDIKVGDHLIFSGTQSGNAISASSLRLIAQGSFGPGGFGRGPGGFGPPRGPGPNGPNGPKPPGTPKPPSA
jgi:hypothetical protein